MPRDMPSLYMLLPCGYAVVLVIVTSVAAIRKRFEHKPEGVMLTRDDHEVI